MRRWLETTCSTVIAMLCMGHRYSRVRQEERSGRAGNGRTGVGLFSHPLRWDPTEPVPSGVEGVGERPIVRIHCARTCGCRHRPIRYLISALCTLTSFSSAFAIDTLDVRSPDPVTEEWRWTTFDRSTGLVGEVRDGTEDPTGNLWFATEAGVQKYDGYRWTTFTIADGLISDDAIGVAASADGSVWCLSAEGVCYLMPSADRWKHLDQLDLVEMGYEKPVYPDRYRGFLLASADGSIWVAGSYFRPAEEEREGAIGGRIDRIRRDTRTGAVHVERVDLPIDVLMDAEEGRVQRVIREGLLSSDGSAWFATRRQGVLRFRDGRWDHYSSANGLAGNHSADLCEDENGRIWVACSESGLSVYDPEKDAWVTVVPDSNDRFSRVGIDEEGSVLAYGIGTSFRYFRLRDEVWEQVSVNDLREGQVWGGLEASDGSFWMWNRNVRVRRYEAGRARWTTFAHQELSDLVFVSSSQGNRNLSVIGNDVWIGKQDGVVRFDGSTWTKMSHRDGLPDGRIATVFKAADGALWMAGQHDGRSAAVRFPPGRVRDGGRLFTEEDGFVGPNIYTGLGASNGDVWLGVKGLGSSRSQNGVLRYDGEEWTGSGPDKNGRRCVIYELAESHDGTVWAGTILGLHRYDASTANWIHVGPPPSGILKIWSTLAAADGSVWIGQRHPDGGAARFDPSAPLRTGGKEWRELTTAHGLGSDGVYTVSQTRDGAIWFGTTVGMTRYDGSMMTHYSGRELPLKGFPDVQAIGEDDEGNLWLANRQNVIRFRPDRNPPETRIEFAVDVVSSLGNIVIQWSGADKWMDTPTEEMRYQYRLGEREWSQPVRRRDMTLTSLADGDYRLEVRAIDRDGNIDPTPAVHAFIVEPPWWRDPRFAFPIGGLIVLVLIQSSRVIARDRRLQSANEALSSANNELFHANVQIKEQSERKSAFLASMSHELRTPMNAIKGFTNLVMRREPTLSDRGTGNLQKVDQASDHLLAMINDLLDLSKIEAGRMDVDATTFDLKDLITSSCDTVSPLVKDGVTLSYDTNGVGQVHTDQARLRQMLINLLSNAVKFTDSGTVTVAAKREPGSGRPVNLRRLVRRSCSGGGRPCSRLTVPGSRPFCLRYWQRNPTRRTVNDFRRVPPGQRNRRGGRRDGSRAVDNKTLRRAPRRIDRRRKHRR